MRVNNPDLYEYRPNSQAERNQARVPKPFPSPLYAEPPQPPHTSDKHGGPANPDMAPAGEGSSSNLRPRANSSLQAALTRTIPSIEARERNRTTNYASLISEPPIAVPFPPDTRLCPAMTGPCALTNRPWRSGCRGSMPKGGCLGRCSPEPKE